MDGSVNTAMSGSVSESQLRTALAPLGSCQQPLRPGGGEDKKIAAYTMAWRPKRAAQIARGVRNSWLLAAAASCTLHGKRLAWLSGM